MAPARQIPLRDFFKNPQEAGHQVSPDGKYISYLASYERRLNVFVKPIGRQASPTRVTGETARDIRGYLWKGDRILYAKDFGGDENYHVVSVNLQGEDLKDLTPGEKVQAQIVDELVDDDAHIIVAHNRRNAEVFDVFRINVITGDEQLIAQNPGSITTWLTDHDGKLRVAIATDGVNQTLLYRAREEDEFRPLLTTDFKESLSPLFFTFDNQKLYVSSNRERDKAALFVFNPATAREEELIFEHPEVDVTWMTYSHKRKVPTLIRYTTWKTEYKFLDGESQTHFEQVTAKLPGYQIDFTSSDKSETQFTVRASSDRSPGKVYLFNAAANQLDFISDVAPWLPEAELAETKPVKYTSRDGLTINGYLTLPKAASPGRLPVVIHPHGGPWVRDSWRFDPEMQFLANRGYAVFQMNYRGSTGYGRKFWEASFKQWGRTMQDDITDGVQWLIREGIADPKRIAIYGGSYGGYATLAGIVYTPDLYAAAVDYVGVSNLITFMKTIPPYWKPYLDMLHEMVGDPERDKDMLVAASPVFHADRIKTPLFIAQGANDPRVNKAESDQMVEALKKRGIAVEYMVKDNEGHGFYNEENRFEFYEAMERFLAERLKSESAV